MNLKMHRLMITGLRIDPLRTGTIRAPEQRRGPAMCKSAFAVPAKKKAVPHHTGRRILA